KMPFARLLVLGVLGLGIGLLALAGTERGHSKPDSERSLASVEQVHAAAPVGNDEVPHSLSAPHERQHHPEDSLQPMSLGAAPSLWLEMTPRSWFGAVSDSARPACLARLARPPE